MNGNIVLFWYYCLVWGIRCRHGQVDVVPSFDTVCVSFAFWQQLN